MQEFVTVTGMILKQAPVGEYDRRICLLTKERGKISAFVRGCRKPSSKLAAATNPFSFGQFKLYPGRDSYSVAEADIDYYFEELRNDFEGAYYGMYFAEVADYYCRENNDELRMLKLLFQSLRALTHEAYDRAFIQTVFECKAIGINGEYPGLPKDKTYLEGTVVAAEYIQKSSIEKLFSFQVSKEVLEELKQATEEIKSRCLNHSFKSLEVLKTLY